MIPLIQLKKEEQFNDELSHIVDALKGIAASRYFLLQKRMVQSDQFFKTTEIFMEGMDFEQMDHPFAKAQSRKTGVLMITSDAGFLGALNTRVISAGLSECDSDGLFTVIGSRGAAAMKDARREFTPFPGINDDERLVLAIQVRDHLIQQVLSGQIDRLVVVYPKPISFTLQRITTDSLLPVSEWTRPEQSAKAPTHPLWESRPEDIRQGGYLD